jgi:hypothetical protein
LEDISGTTPFWTRANPATGLLLQGEELEDLGVTLRPGWNLIGTPVPAYLPGDRTIDDGRVWYWVSLQGVYKAMDGTATALQPGIGYWIHNPDELDASFNLVEE